MAKERQKKGVEKDSDFLSQIPHWENDYKTSDEALIDFEKEKWISAKAEFGENDLKIFGYAVMEDWETPYMKELAEIATMKGGRVLELGFGMGISANFIQQHKITEHIIIEANHDVAQRASDFGRKAKYPVTVLEGFWESQIEKIPDNSLSGILFDTYPLTDKELYQNHFNFFPHAYRKLKKGGIFTYYSDEINSFGGVHLKQLQAAGFELKKIRSKVTKVNPPADCEYWKADTILSPIIEK